MTTASAPDGTAVRVALWRALHVEVDPPPHVLDDTVGLRLADPDPDWRARGDMDPDGTRAFRASIVARARFLDDLVREQAAGGVGQYVILGAGLDSFAQRHSELALQIYEVDQPGTQEWKRRRLTEEGYPLPEGLHFVPVDFERGQSWPEALARRSKTLPPQLDTSAMPKEVAPFLLIALARRPRRAITRNTTTEFYSGGPSVVSKD